MENHENVVITADFDGITKWHMPSNDDEEEYNYSVDL